MTEGGWEQFEVDADVGIRGWGPSRAVAVAQLTLGVFALIAAPRSVEARERREVRAQAESPEALLVAWVDECLYVHEIEGFVVHEVEMTVCTDTLAHGYLHGEPLDLARHRIGTVVKGATHHRTALAVQDGLHEARLIVDV
jgi:tRNA nucleotidyltransferase (CCA-adding enzyme)